MARRGGHVPDVGRLLAWWSGVEPSRWRHLVATGKCNWIRGTVAITICYAAGRQRGAAERINGPGSYTRTVSPTDRWSYLGRSGPGARSGSLRRASVVSVRGSALRVLRESRSCDVMGCWHWCRGLGRTNAAGVLVELRCRRVCDDDRTDLPTDRDAPVRRKSCGSRRT